MKNIIGRWVSLINENFMQLQEPSNDAMSVGVSFPRQDHLCGEFLCSCVKSKTSRQSQQKSPFEEGIGGISSHSSPPRAQSLPGIAEGEAWPPLHFLTGCAGAERPWGRKPIPQKEKESPGGLE